MNEKNFLFKNYRRVIFLVVWILFSFISKGQWISSPPVQNASIAPGEYGNTTQGMNQIQSGAGNTYMNWDNNNLYCYPDSIFF